jgi:hypothetical protein
MAARTAGVQGCGREKVAAVQDGHLSWQGSYRAPARAGSGSASEGRGCGRAGTAGIRSSLAACLLWHTTSPGHGWLMRAANCWV